MLTVPLFGYAIEKVDKTLNVSKMPNVSIDVKRGSVDIQSWDKDRIQVIGTLDELSEGFVFKRDGDSVLIEDDLPNQFNGGNKSGSKLIIKVPKSLNLNLDGISTNLNLKDLDGDIHVETISGSIDAENLSGKPSLQTVSGALSTKQLSGWVRLNSISGNIETTPSVTNELRVKNVSGDVVVNVGDKFTRLRAQTVSGDIELVFAEMPKAAFSLNGGPGGSIRNHLSKDLPFKAKYTGSESMSFKTGIGRGNVFLNTVSGTLMLKKK